MKGANLPSTEQFKAAIDSTARALGWFRRIGESSDGENAVLRCDALLQLSLAAQALGYDLTPRLEGKNAREP